MTEGLSDKKVLAGVRIIALNLPEDEGEGLGFRLTRTLWDPYPWVREVTVASRADAAGLKTGDCILQADGTDLLGLPVGQVAGLIRGDGGGRGVSLLVWSCGVDPGDDPELLWSGGGGERGERARRALGGCVRALACSVCEATARRPLSCARSHLYCEGCWSRLQRCALCRETLPAKESPYAKNLVAEQVFEAIATEYEIKDSLRKPTETTSARASPNISPSAGRKGHYQISMMQRRKFGDRFLQIYSSVPNLSPNKSYPEIGEHSKAGNTCQNCHPTARPRHEAEHESSARIDCKLGPPTIKIDCEMDKEVCEIPVYELKHKLMQRLTAGSMVDLKCAGVQHCGLSKSLNNINYSNNPEAEVRSGSLDNVQVTCPSSCVNTPVLLVTPAPLYLLTCEHVSEMRT